MNPKKLLHKVALVTGASRGIGREIALKLASEGANVAVNYFQRADAALDTVAEVKRRGVESIALQADVSKKADVDAMINQVAQIFGSIDILVNNAGVETEAAFLELSEADWDWIMGVNLKGIYLCSQAAANQMLNCGGRILNITSICGHVVFSRFAHYSASKAGANMLTKAMAVELAPYNITVNAIAPGWIRTEMSERDLASVAGMEAKVIQHTPLRRIGEPLDVANLVAFLCSDDAKWITGQIFTVDGGFEIWRDV